MEIENILNYNPNSLYFIEECVFDVRAALYETQTGGNACNYRVIYGIISEFHKDASNLYPFDPSWWNTLFYVEGGVRSGKKGKLISYYELKSIIQSHLNGIAPDNVKFVEVIYDADRIEEAWIPVEIEYKDRKRATGMITWQNSD